MSQRYKTVTGQALHFLVRPHHGRPAGPVTSAAAWRRGDLADESRWVARLDAREVDELEAALRHAKQTQKPLAALGKDDFPLPTLSARIHRWGREVNEGLGVQVIRGVPVERWSLADSERFFWCFGQHMGHVGAQNRDGELLGHVRDQGGSYQDLSTRGYKTAAKLDYHCDAADVVGLLCLQTAKRGGLSRFVSSVTVWNDLAEARPDLAARMFEPLAFDTRGDGGVDFFRIAPCRFAGGKLRTFYHADYFRSAERQPGAPRLSRAEHEMLDAYDAMASDPKNFVEQELAIGDVQLLSNHTVLHSRSAYEDHEEPERKRHLLRLWLSLPHRRELGELPSMGAEALRLLGGLAKGRVTKRLAAGRAAT